MLVDLYMATHKDPPQDDEANRAMREANELPQPSFVDLDPEDPSQVLNDLEVEEEEEEEEVSEPETGPQLTIDTFEEADKDKDAGDLYGVHSPKAADHDLAKTPDQESFLESEEGENWLETLNKKSAEYGAEEEEEIDVVDDSDEHREHRGHHKTDTRDRPVADKGSGGISGM